MLVCSRRCRCRGYGMHLGKVVTGDSVVVEAVAVVVAGWSVVVVVSAVGGWGVVAVVVVSVVGGRRVVVVAEVIVVVEHWPTHENIRYIRLYDYKLWDKTTNRFRLLKVKKILFILECGPMPNVKADSEYRWRPLLKMMRNESSIVPFLVPCRKVWLTSTAPVPCSNAAKTGERKTWTQSEFCTWENS